MGALFELLAALVADRAEDRITAPPDDQSRTVAAYRDAWALRGGTAQHEATLRAQLERHNAPTAFASPTDEVGPYLYDWFHSDFHSDVSPRQMKKRLKTVFATLRLESD